MENVTAYRVQGYRGFSDCDGRSDYNFDKIIWFDSRFSEKQIERMLACSVFDTEKYRCVAYEFSKIGDIDVGTVIRK